MKNGRRFGSPPKPWFNRGIDRFLRRGRSAARSEWRLITAGGNLLKLHRPQLRLAIP